VLITGVLNACEIIVLIFAEVRFAKPKLASLRCTFALLPIESVATR